MSVRIRTLLAMLVAPACWLLLPTGASAQEEAPTCFVCDGEWDMETQKWVPGSIGCDDAGPGEKGRDNCMDDQHGTECEMDGYELCDAEPTEEELLVFLPGSSGIPGAITHITYRTNCKAVNGSQTLVHVVTLD